MITKNIYITSLSPGNKVSDYFAIAEAKQGQAKNGPFWNLLLQDNSGRIQARIWSPMSSEYKKIPAGSIAFIQGQVGSFRDQVQIQIESLEIVPEFEPASDLPLFALCSKEEPGRLMAELEEICQEVLTYKPWRTLCAAILKDENIRSRFLTSYGGKSIHHAYVGGLLEHTLSVCKLCMAIAAHYSHLDSEILLVAAICHDLGKAWELSQGLSTDYTDEGRLLGHIHITMDVLDPFLKKQKTLEPGLVTHLKHIILSHHGEYEFGSPKRPKTAEAFVLHYADNLDAKLNILDQAFDGDDPETPNQWSEYQRSLERFVFNPLRTDTKTKKAKEKADSQCFLPLKG